MNKILCVLFTLILSTNLLFAADPFDEFKNQITNVTVEVAQSNLDNFAMDLGALLGGGSFHQGQYLGFPGLDIGVHVPVKSTNKDNAIVKAAGLETILLPVIQAEIGLPKRIDLIGRFMSFANSTMIGVGARYGLIKSKVPGIPSVSFQAIYNMLDANAGDNKFKADTLNLCGVASFALASINPYIGLGMDVTNVNPDSSINLPRSGMKGSASGYRLEAGVNLSLLPATYLQLGGVLSNSDFGYTIGLGLKF